jgi:hypothetical protein
MFGRRFCDVLVAREVHGLFGEATQPVLERLITARLYSSRPRMS